MSGQLLVWFCKKKTAQGKKTPTHLNLLFDKDCTPNPASFKHYMESLIIFSFLKRGMGSSTHVLHNLFKRPWLHSQMVALVRNWLTKIMLFIMMISLIGPTPSTRIGPRNQFSWLRQTSSIVLSVSMDQSWLFSDRTKLQKL